MNSCHMTFELTLVNYGIHLHGTTCCDISQQDITASRSMKMYPVINERQFKRTNPPGEAIGYSGH
eukprot:1113450-Prorocentrum_minimum.AAC.1